MKKIPLIILLAVAFSMNANAQASFSLGVKAGPNFSNISGDNVDDIYESRTGWHAGIFTNLKVTKFAIQPELLISSQGAKADILINQVSQVTQNKLTYFTVPVMLQFYPIGVLNIQAGPQFGFLMNAKQTWEDQSVDIENLYKSSDLGIAFGIGLNLPMGLTATARYTLGIADTWEAATQELKNRLIMISIGYKFIDLGR